jgi:hypothetical protein
VTKLENMIILNQINQVFDLFSVNSAKTKYGFSYFYASNYPSLRYYRITVVMKVEPDIIASNLN